MPSDTAVCETCGGSSYDNEDPDTGKFWCRKCDGWQWFKWSKTGERHTRKQHKPRRDGFPVR
jgi:hypothetical protein